MEIQQVGNGININVINTEKFKTVTICALLRRPLRREEVTINALIPGILKRGCARYENLSKINERLEQMYGGLFDVQIVKKGEEQIIQFLIEIVNSDESSIKEAFEFLKDIMTEVLVEDEGFNKAYSDGEISNLRNAICGRMNNKSEYAKLRCLEEMCSGEPFGIYADGYVEDLEGINHKNAYDHYMKILKESVFDIVVIGKVDINKMKEYTAEYFGFERNEIIKIPPAEIVYIKNDEKRYDESMGSTQGKICIGLRSGIEPTTDCFYHLLTANEILGGGPGSKLFARIREKESLCYYINSFVYRFKTILFIQSGVDSSNFDRVLSLVREEIEGIKAGQISDEDLSAAKKSIVKKFKGMKDNPSAIMNFYITQAMLKDNDSIEDAVKRIESINAEAVIKSAENLLVDTVFTLA